MGKIFQGGLVAEGFRFAIVVSRFNETITSKLLDGAEDTLRRHGAKEQDIDVVWTPGAFEVPLAAQRLAVTGRYQAIVCLSSIIRGETPHFDYVAGHVTGGVGKVGLDSGIPTTFGVITADTVEQAMNRAGMKSGNKGSDAALAAIEMANLFKELD